MILLLLVHSFSFAAQRISGNYGKVREWIVNKVQQVCVSISVFFVLKGNLRSRYPAVVRSATLKRLNVANFMISLLQNSIESCLFTMSDSRVIDEFIRVDLFDIFLHMSNSNILWLAYPGISRRRQWIWAHMSPQKHQWLPFSSRRSYGALVTLYPAGYAQHFF